MSGDRPSLNELRIDREEEDGREPSRAGWGGLVVLLLVVAVGVFWWVRHGRSVEVRTVAVQAPDPTRQRVLLNASGYVTARREATVSSKITGKVSEVLIEEGMKVAEDAVLARLDDVNLRANLDLAEAEWQSAQAAQTETRVRLDEAEKELLRVQSLVTNQVASASDLDRAEAEVNSLKARLEKQGADAVVADRQVALWRQQVEDTVIRAPFSGVVTAKNAQPGEMISPMSAGGGFTRTGIGTIVDMNSLEIEVDVNESYINRVQPGQPVEATLDAYLDWTISAHVIAIIPSADRQKSTVKVRVGFERLDPRILPEMSVKVAFLREGEVPPAERYPTVPGTAVVEEEGRTVVWMVAEGRASRRLVEVAARTGEQVSVAAGISVGDRVIIEGRERLREGLRVRESKR